MITAILLAGGTGTRMGAAIPKQYLPLDGKPIACHSLEVFLAHPEITACVVVCAPAFRHHFASYDVTFAEPGERRQDSLFNGLKHATTDWICVHDAARPYITAEMVSDVIAAGLEVGAATLAMPTIHTIKVSDENQMVTQTLEREKLWEVQTPQVVKLKTLIDGFTHIGTLTVTDDVSLAESLGKPVKLVKGSYGNKKITTPNDL